MASINSKYYHNLNNLNLAKQNATELANSLKAYGISWKWQDDTTIAFDAPSGMAKGTKGKVVVSENDVNIEIDLPMMLRFMKATIEQQITAKLDAIFKAR